MNFLAHCFLSCSDDELLFGNLITDLLNPKELSKFSDRIADGISLHRAIDSYTDEHELSIRLRHSLRERHGKYAPVVVDLVWDYYLAENWAAYAQSELTEFTSECYALMERKVHLLPGAAEVRLKEMIHHDFLNAYSGINRAKQSLKWMDKRARFKSCFSDAILDIAENDEIYNRWFNRFFPDIIAHIEDSCACQPSK